MTNYGKISISYKDHIISGTLQSTRYLLQNITILNNKTLEKYFVFHTYKMQEKVKVKSLSRVQLFTTPWTVVYQASQFMGFSRQEYWSGLPLPSPGDLPDPGIEPWSPTLQADTLPSEPQGKPEISIWYKDHIFSGALQSTRYLLQNITILNNKTLEKYFVFHTYKMQEKL